MANNTLWACGYNSYGQLGKNNTTNYSSPVQVGSLTNWAAGSCGYNSTYLINTSGQLWTWGNNIVGQLGLGNTTDCSSPVQVGSLTNWKSVSGGGGFHSDVLNIHLDFQKSIKTDGTLWGCGSNYFGQLGNNTNGTQYSSPIQIGSLTNWASVSCGYGHSLAIKTDGTLWACGYNVYGQLGNGVAGPGTSLSSPIQIGSLTNWASVSCGYTSNAAIKTDGTLWTWGNNIVGQLGLGNTTDCYSPVQVGSLTNWKSVSASGFNSIVDNDWVDCVLAVKTDGTLWGWGYNASGQLGLGNTTKRSSPVQVGSLTNWSTVTIVGSHSLAIKTDGTLWACGYNGTGELGSGNRTSKSSPIQIGAATTWSKVLQGNGVYTIALQSFINDAFTSTVTNSILLMGCGI